MTKIYFNLIEPSYFQLIGKLHLNELKITALLWLWIMDFNGVVAAAVDAFGCRSERLADAAEQTAWQKPMPSTGLEVGLARSSQAVGEWQAE